jgi:hypothetical protein
VAAVIRESKSQDYTIVYAPPSTLGHFGITCTFRPPQPVQTSWMTKNVNHTQRVTGTIKSQNFDFIRSEHSARGVITQIKPIASNFTFIAASAWKASGESAAISEQCNSARETPYAP